MAIEGAMGRSVKHDGKEYWVNEGVLNFDDILNLGEKLISAPYEPEYTYLTTRSYSLYRNMFLDPTKLGPTGLMET